MALTEQDREGWYETYRKLGFPYSKTPLTEEGVCNIIGYNMHWNLHRFVKGKHYVGHAHQQHHKAYVQEINPDNVINWLPYDSRETTDTHPYTDAHKESFMALSEDELIQLAESHMEKMKPFNY